MNNTNETLKTGLLGIAGAFTVSGTVALANGEYVGGSVLLLLGAVVLVVRGALKAKNLI